MGRPAIFLDRDGVINENRADHVKSWDEFRFVPGAVDSIAALTRLRFPIVIVTNQAAVNRGLVSAGVVDDIHRRMIAHLRQHGGRIDAVLCCPHAPSERCGCRKPEPGLLRTAAARHDVDLARSVFVGDSSADMLAGKRVGCHAILVLTGRGRETLRLLGQQPTAIPHAVAADLASAVPMIAGAIRRPPTRVRPEVSAGTRSMLPAVTHGALAHPGAFGPAGGALPRD